MLVAKVKCLLLMLLMLIFTMHMFLPVLFVVAWCYRDGVVFEVLWFGTCTP